MPSLQDPNRLSRALCSLEGLSVGDAFGERFFVHPDTVESLVAERAVPTGDWNSGDSTQPQPIWTYTDDTIMALSVVDCLRRFGQIDQDWLVRDFAARYHPSRGYGPSMHRYLAEIREGADWREMAPRLFEGQGSHGNGAAMRVAPLGGWFSNDLEQAVAQARLSAEVTHAHPEGIAGAIAVAVAALFACRMKTEGIVWNGRDFLDRVRAAVPDSIVCEKIRHARNLAPDASVQLAVAALGNGMRISAQDTVPFALWCAARHLDNYEEALWLTVSGLGDRDTTCAIVGGIVSLYMGVEKIPILWRHHREPLPDEIIAGNLQHGIIHL